MKPLVVLVTALTLGACIFMGCAAAAPPAPSDVADCSNLPANGPKIKIENPWAKATSGGEAASSAAAPSTMGSGNQMGSAINTAAFMVIHNCGVQAETLVKATSNLDGMTKLMNFELKDGKSTMTTVSQIDIPAGKKVELKSGGYHIMFMNLKNHLKPGDPVELTLSFKTAGDIKITPTVKNP